MTDGLTITHLTLYSRIKPKKTLKTAQFTSITKIATVLSSVRIFKILNNEREIKYLLSFIS